MKNEGVERHLHNRIKTLPQNHNSEDDEEFGDEVYCKRYYLKLSKMIPKPTINFSTEYKKSFKKGSMKMESPSTFKNTPFNLKTVSTLSTEYQNSFHPFLSKSIKLQDKKKDDNVRSQTPTSNLTTYSTTFIGHKGDNQYVKVKEAKIEKSLKFRGQSIYKRNYTEKGLERLQKFKKNEKKVGFDDERVNKSMLQSTYKKQFLTKQKQEQKQAFDENDYNSQLLFNCQVEKKIQHKTIYGQNFKNREVPENRIIGAKNKFKIYQQKQVEILKKKFNPSSLN